MLHHERQEMLLNEQFPCSLGLPGVFVGRVLLASAVVSTEVVLLDFHHRTAHKVELLQEASQVRLNRL